MIRLDGSSWILGSDWMDLLGSLDQIDWMDHYININHKVDTFHSRVSKSVCDLLKDGEGNGCKLNKGKAQVISGLPGVDELSTI